MVHNLYVGSTNDSPRKHNYYCRFLARNGNSWLFLHRHGEVVSKMNPQNSKHNNPNGARRFIGIALLLFGFFNGLGVGSAVPVLTSEINSVRLRSKGTSIGWGCDALFSWIFGFFVPYLFNSDELNWGGKIGFFFFGLSIIGVVLIWLEIPETKGKSYYELDYLFEMKTKTRAFRHAVVRQDIGLSKEDVF